MTNKAIVRRVGRKSYRVSGEKYLSVRLPQETELAPDALVVVSLVERGGAAVLQRGDVVLRKAKEEQPCG